MRVLHITNNYPTPTFPAFGIFVKEQIESLRDKGIDCDVFFINGRENSKIKYLSSVFKLRHLLRSGRYEILHCHHFLSALVLLATFMFSKFKIVVSFQNDPLKESGYFIYRIIRKYFDLVIFKNESTLISDVNNSVQIPNGVNLNLFKPIPKDIARARLNLDMKSKYLLFMSSNYIRQQKRYDRFKGVITTIKDKYGIHDINEIILTNCERNLVPYYINAADVHVLTSDFEGSPNSVKECMACNVSVVSTDVGNVRTLIKGLTGYYLSPSFDIEEITKLTIHALKEKKTNGRDRIKELNLDIESIAEKIILYYKKLINNQLT